MAAAVEVALGKRAQPLEVGVHKRTSARRPHDDLPHILLLGPMAAVTWLRLRSEIGDHYHTDADDDDDEPGKSSHGRILTHCDRGRMSSSRPPLDSCNASRIHDSCTYLHRKNAANDANSSHILAGLADLKARHHPIDDVDALFFDHSSAL